MKYATKKAAKEILDKYKNQTRYFDGEIEMEIMKEMFRYIDLEKPKRMLF